MKQVILKKSDEWVNFGFNLERPYIRIHTFKLLGDKADNNFMNLEFNWRGKTSQRGIISNRIFAQATSYKTEVLVGKEIELENAITFEMQYVSKDENLMDAEILVQYEDFKRISIENPKLEFQSHLDKIQNTKILFSAPFGQGKTTFLNEYFKDKLDKYEIFRVFPVNYSVAQNEDIFRYIKADILFQLISDKNIEFEKIDANYAKTIPKFLKKDIHKVLAPFLMLIPGVGKDLFSIFEKLNGVSEKFFEAHDREGKNEEEESNKFLKVISEKEGSIFEDNFITQLLRQQIKKIANSGKETALIIDDLDRVDPEHTFRILNVISAHYDTFNNAPIYENNKFGFDKIILVCDLQNIRYTFEHRYGAKVNFSGYISKFYSTSPFQYDNKKMMLVLINEIDDISFRNNPNSVWRRILHLVIEPIILMDLIALRDIYKMKSIGINQFFTKLRNDHSTSNFYFNRGLLTPVIKLLSEIFPLEQVIAKFEECEKSNFRMNHDLEKDIAFPLIATLASNTDKPHIYSYVLKSKDLKFKFGLDTDSNSDHTIMHPNQMQITGSDTKEVHLGNIYFEFSDFCFLVIENIRRYNSLQR